MQIRPFFLTLLLGFMPAPALAGELYGPPETAPPEGLVPPAPTTTIRAIAVRGNQRIPDDRVLLSIALNPGDRATAKDLAATQAKVMAMGYFHACRVGFEPQGRLVIEVQENPVFGDVRLTGVTKLDPEQLQIMLGGIGALPEEAMRADGMFGPQIDVPEDADDQTRLLAFMGRRA